MMKPFCLLFAITLCQLCWCQQIELPDTLRAKVENDSGLVDLFYEKLLYPNGNIRYEGWTYVVPVPGKDRHAIFRIGNWHMYYKDGTLMLNEFYPYEATNRIKSTQFDKKGRLFFEFDFLVTQYGDKFALIPGSENYVRFTWPKEFCGRSYHKNGVLAREFCKVSISKKDGVYARYYENGNVKLKGLYDMGKKTGQWSWYKEDGNLKKSRDYSD